MGKTPEWKNQKVCTVDSFTIILSFEDEDTCMRKSFIEDCGWTKSEFSEIRNYYWFIAKVSAYKGRVECGSAYLGGNCYKNLKAVMAGGNVDEMLSGYMRQLISEAIGNAVINLISDNVKEWAE